MIYKQVLKGRSFLTGNTKGVTGFLTLHKGSF